MGMAGEHVDKLVRVVLHFQQHLIDLPPGLHSQRPFIHAVVCGNTFRKRGVHSHHNGANRIVFTIAFEHAREPLHLRWIELVVGSVIEINEIDSVADPVKISLRLRGFRIIFQPLFL